MIDQKCFSKEWITQKADELGYPDKNLLEKSIHAFALLDMLARLRFVGLFSREKE